MCLGSVCGGITALSGRFTLIRGVLSVFHRGTIIPESKLRRVHGRVDESCSFSSSAVCSLPPDIRSERRCFVHQTHTHTHTNTKDSKLWKSQRKRATETCDTWFYLLWFRVDTQSYLEPYRVYFKSLFIMFWGFCFVFFFSWAGWCSSQYYYVVDDCTATLFLLHLNVFTFFLFSFFFFCNYFEYF